MNQPSMVLMLLLLVALLYVLLSIRKDFQDEDSEQEEELQLTLRQIEIKKAELQDLETQVNYKRRDRLTGLPVAVERILNEYDRLSIRIPADIIEELHVLRFDSDAEIRAFIENQRQQWKYENSKKPMKKVKG